MRIPHYLHKAPSGVFHFRRRMPSCLHALVGRQVIKKSLLTRDVGVARDLALKLWRAYDELHQHVRKLSTGWGFSPATLPVGFLGTGIDGNFDQSKLTTPEQSQFKFTTPDASPTRGDMSVALADRFAANIHVDIANGQIASVTGKIGYQSPEGPVFQFGNVQLPGVPPFTFTPTIGVANSYQLDWGSIVFFIEASFNENTREISGNGRIEIKF